MQIRYDGRFLLDAGAGLTKEDVGHAFGRSRDIIRRSLAKGCTDDLTDEIFDRTSP